MWYQCNTVVFLSTLSLRRATSAPARKRTGRNHFYPRSPCGERRCAPSANGGAASISIHALLAESDAEQVYTAVLTKISIHALLAESDTLLLLQANRLSNFYPRSPCGERPYGRINDISRLIFLSTLSLRRATLDWYLMILARKISIHALLAESDLRRSASIWLDRYFYPRSPCGERPYCPHMPHVVRDFYPRSPCGERHVFCRALQNKFSISIHALLAESDTSVLPTIPAPTISIHALLAESDALTGSSAYCQPGFLSTLSLRRATA